ncbi:MAG TPA: diguanylate cyclase [Thermoanaerobaculia bacterium]|nr:diguanylate cyclase [Thermoanaerobaculia bacterium]
MDNDQRSEAETFAMLREKFVQSSVRRLDDLARLLDLIEANPTDAAALDEIVHKLHGLGGIGTTFGFPTVTTAARDTEAEAGAALAAGVAVPTEALARWRGAIDQIREALAAGGQPVPSEWEAAAASATVPIDILLLEDDPVGHRILQRVLEKQGMQVRGALTLTAALELLATKMPDAIVSDIFVPDGRGYQLIERLRSLPGGESRPAIITSGLAGFADRVQAVRCGADAFFHKPLDYTELVRALENLLELAKGEPRRVRCYERSFEKSTAIASILEDGGFEARISTSVNRFDADLSSQRPDLVVLDTRLPDADGYELARYIRQKPGFATTPIVFISSEAGPRAHIAGVDAGADDYLIYPVDPGILLATVKARINRARFVRHLVEHDELTGLLTQSAFLRHLKQLWADRYRHPEQQPTIIMLDLDHFKAVNDTHGHTVGDRVLASLGMLLRKRLRRSDTVARYGGEEFAILVPDLSTSESVRLIDRLREEFASIEQLGAAGAAFTVTYSAGIAAMPPSSARPEDWIAAADRALYDAKHGGRNRVVAA